MTLALWHGIGGEPCQANEAPEQGIGAETTQQLTLTCISLLSRSVHTPSQCRRAV